MSAEQWDVIIVGAGNAACCAALSAREQGASVLMLERAPEDESGGNSRFTAGSMRVVYNGVEDIRKIVPDLSDEEVAITDFGTYTQDQFFDDMFRVTEFRTDPDLSELLVTRSLDTVIWMREKGVRFVPIYGRQAFKIDGKFKFWGGLTVESVGGGPGLVDTLHNAARRDGVERFAWMDHGRDGARRRKPRNDSVDARPLRQTGRLAARPRRLKSHPRRGAPGQSADARPRDPAGRAGAHATTCRRRNDSEKRACHLGR